MYKGNIKGSIFGGLASGVPGDLRGLEYLHSKYGVRFLLRSFHQCCILIVSHAGSAMEGGSSSCSSCCKIWISGYVFSSRIIHHQANTHLVTEDLADYMQMVIDYGFTFLTDDPQWSIDFAPKGWL
jgi:gamma-glutamyltranspeptidase/glutathione hydrolase